MLRGGEIERGTRVRRLSLPRPKQAYNFTGTKKILRGTTWKQPVTLKVDGVAWTDLQNYTTLRCQFRKGSAPTGLSGVVYFDTQTGGNRPQTLVVEFLQAGDGGAGDGGDGKLMFRISEADTVSVKDSPLSDTNDTIKGVYQLEGFDGANTVRIAEGEWEMDQEGTRPNP